MVQKTAYRGVGTKKVLRRYGLKGKYSRYPSPQTRIIMQRKAMLSPADLSQLQVVKHKPDFNLIYKQQGGRLIPHTLEIKHENVFGADNIGAIKRNKLKFKRINVFLKRNPQWKNKIVIRR